eukprot:scaffold17402_cov63-Phaeocystis_antarctica.AAC.3
MHTVVRGRIVASGGLAGALTRDTQIQHTRHVSRLQEVWVSCESRLYVDENASSPLTPPRPTTESEVVTGRACPARCRAACSSRESRSRPT